MNILSNKTPKSVKWLIVITAALSLLVPVATYYFAPISSWLSLSLFGLKQLWLWQPLTYFFLNSAGIGISFALLFTLFLQMVLLWFTGSEIDARFGSKQFLTFYLGAGLFAGIIASLALLIFNSSTLLATSAPPILALMLVWAMIYPDLELTFLFFVRIKTKWLIALYLVFSLLISLSYGAGITFLADLSGILFGFLVGRYLWKLPNPYPLNLEFRRKPSKKASSDDKVIDISVFQESDEAFMDRMLAKISQKGADSLTAREKTRMQKISERRNK